jgi:protein CpxP
MKKLSLITAMALGGLLACSTIAIAQPGTNAAPDTNAAPKKGKSYMTPEQRLDRMSTQLNLTDEQKPKVKAVLDDTAKKMQDLAPEDRREKGRAIREEETTKLKEILTPEQMDKYTKMQEEMRKKGKKKSE